MDRLTGAGRPTYRHYARFRPERLLVCVVAEGFGRYLPRGAIRDGLAPQISSKVG